MRSPRNRRATAASWAGYEDTQRRARGGGGDLPVRQAGWAAAGWSPCPTARAASSSPRCPPAPTRVRALRDGHQPAPRAQGHGTARPGRDLHHQPDPARPRPRPRPRARPPRSSSEAAPAQRELRWLLRHKTPLRAGVPATTGGAAVASLASTASSVARPAVDAVLPSTAAVELLADPGDGRRGRGAARPASRIRAASASSGSTAGWARASWSLGGLVAESEGTTWRMVAEFVLEPVDGHQIQVGTGYGTHLFRSAVPLDKQGRLGTRSGRAPCSCATAGRPPRSSPPPSAAGSPTSASCASEPRRPFRRASSCAPDQDSRVHGAVLDDDGGAGRRPARPLHAERRARARLRPAGGRASGRSAPRASRSACRRGSGARGSARTPSTRASRTSSPTPSRARGPLRSLRIFNAGQVSARGAGRHARPALRGRAERLGDLHLRPQLARDAAGAPATRGRCPRVLTYEDAGFHDVVARLETSIDQSDTRLIAFYRFNSLMPGGRGRRRSAPARQHALRRAAHARGCRSWAPSRTPTGTSCWRCGTSSTRSDEGATLDELAVLNPPRRVLGGISVRF